MNTTLQELRAAHDRLGKLIDQIASDDSHKKLMSLVGVCYVKHSGKGFEAHKINKIDVTQRNSGGVIVIYFDGVSAHMSDGSTDSSGALTIDVYEDFAHHYTFDGALKFAEMMSEVDMMKSAEFDHLKTLAKHRKQSAWEQLCAAATV